MEDNKTNVAPISLDEIVELMSQLKEVEKGNDSVSAYAIFEVYSYSGVPTLRIRVYSSDDEFYCTEIKDPLNKGAESRMAFGEAMSALRNPEVRATALRRQIERLNKALEDLA